MRRSRGFGVLVACAACLACAQPGTGTDHAWRSSVAAEGRSSASSLRDREPARYVLGRVLVDEELSDRPLLVGVRESRSAWDHLSDVQDQETRAGARFSVEVRNPAWRSCALVVRDAESGLWLAWIEDVEPVAGDRLERARETVVDLRGRLQQERVTLQDPGGETLNAAYVFTAGALGRDYPGDLGSFGTHFDPWGGEAVRDFDPGDPAMDVIRRAESSEVLLWSPGYRERRVDLATESGPFTMQPAPEIALEFSGMPDDAGRHWAAELIAARDDAPTYRIGFQGFGDRVTFQPPFSGDFQIRLLTTVRGGDGKPVLRRFPVWNPVKERSGRVEVDLDDPPESLIVEVGDDTPADAARDFAMKAEVLPPGCIDELQVTPLEGDDLRALVRIARERMTGTSWIDALDELAQSRSRQPSVPATGAEAGEPVSLIQVSEPAYSDDGSAIVAARATRHRPGRPSGANHYLLVLDEDEHGIWSVRESVEYYGVLTP